MARKILRVLAWVAFALAVLIGIARATAIRWWRVPGDDPYFEASIAPTLRVGDLIVLFRLTPPHLGDLVLCPEPGAPERTVVGRVAGAAGDEIKIQGTYIHVNGKKATSANACEEGRFTVNDPATGQEYTLSCSLEELGGAIHPRGDAPDSRPALESKLSVEEGQLFLLSDNRAFPYDSRDFGLVDAEGCREKVVFRLLGETGYGDVSRRFSVVR